MFGWCSACPGHELRWLLVFCVLSLEWNALHGLFFLHAIRCRSLSPSVASRRQFSPCAIKFVWLLPAGAWVKLRNVGAFATRGQLQAAYHVASKL